MNYTTSTLISLLEKFPQDLIISTELAFMWNYPDELLVEKDCMSDDEFKELTIKNATGLCIFEGSWEKGNVSDVDGKFEEFQNIK